MLIQVFRKGGLFQAWRRGLETQGLLTDGGEGKEGFCGLFTQHALTTEMMASIEGLVDWWVDWLTDWLIGWPIS